MNAVIDYDISKERYSPEALVANASRTAVARRLPAFDQQFLCAKSLSLRDVELQEERQIATHLDDPVLIAYESKYIGKVFLDEGALFKIFKISIITKKDREIWEVTCVELDAQGNVPATSLVKGSSEILDSKHVGYGIKDSIGTPYFSVDEMILDYQEFRL